MAARKEILEKLHEKLGEQLLKRVESGDATAAEFAQAIKFLKDNGIEAIPTAGSALDELSKSVAKDLPFSDPSDFPNYN